MTSSRTAPPPAAQDRLAALESLDDLIICLDPELRVVTWNRAAERMLGRGASSVIGSALMTLVAPERRPDIRPLLERALRGETVARHDTTLLRTDGAATAVSLAIAPVVDGAGKTGGLLLLGHD
jgi:PAS domain S-box-containing protein